MPLLKTLIYKRENGNEFQEFTIRKKDYGEMSIYDIHFGDIFLFTISQEGKVLLSNWEAAKNAPISLDEESLNQINIFIVNEQHQATKAH